MFKHITIAALLFGFALCGALATEAKAVENYAGVHVVNKTDQDINFDARFGEESWTTYTLKAGGGRYFWAKFEAPGVPKHDRIQVKFDKDMGPELSWRTITPYVKHTEEIDWKKFQQYEIHFKDESKSEIEFYYLD